MKCLPWQKQVCEDGKERKGIRVLFLWTTLISRIIAMLQTERNEPDLTLTQEFIPLTQTMSMRQHSDRIILQMKIVESKCKKMLKAPKAKWGRRKKAKKLFHQNGRKRKQSRKTVKKGGNVRVCH